MIHRLKPRFCFFSSLITVVGLTCKTRAVSRMPPRSLPFRRFVASLSQVTRVGIVQQKRASSPLSTRPAAVALLDLTGGVVSDNISALAVGAVQDLDNHDVTRLAWGCSDRLTL